MLLAASLPAMEPVGTAAWAGDLRYFRIGTAATDSTYFPVGSLIASVISSPPGAPECETDQRCGIAGLIAVAQSTAGSVENLALLRDGVLDAVLVQANLAHWAFHGTGYYRRHPPFKDLRAVASLFVEAIHVVVRQDSALTRIEELRGRSVSIGAPGSGTQVDARLVLSAHGLQPSEIHQVVLRTGESADRLRSGALGAFFAVGSPPLSAVRDLAERLPIRLLPFAPSAVHRLTAQYPFLIEMAVPGGVYAGVDTTKTLGIAALLLVRETLEPDLVYALVRTLWHKRTGPLFKTAGTAGQAIRLAEAGRGVSIPFHPGARRFYRERGSKIEPAPIPAANADPVLAAPGERTTGGGSIDADKTVADQLVRSALTGVSAN